MSIASIIKKYSSLPPDAVREWSPGSIKDIESAILFVLATWSGPSVAAFILLTKRLASTPESPVLLVCDIDNVSAETDKIFDRLSGVGETFWIRDGQVVASLHDYTTNDWFNSVDSNGELLRPPPR